MPDGYDAPGGGVIPIHYTVICQPDHPLFEHFCHPDGTPKDRSELQDQQTEEACAGVAGLLGFAAAGLCIVNDLAHGRYGEAAFGATIGLFARGLGRAFAKGRTLVARGANGARRPPGCRERPQAAYDDTSGFGR